MPRDETPLDTEDQLPPNPLFENLVPATANTRTLDDKLTFAQAMPRMGMSSVFDIIRQPKGEFALQLRTLSDADGELAYDNALCYATQIARSYREDVVSSGRDLPLIAPQTGVRALVDIGPSYPNLFKENWDQFCKVGAIEAMDGPVAYLASLRRFAAEKIEGASTSPRRIPLAVRRPDLDTLVIDEQSTYQSRPMLDLVNDVLIQGIDKYQAEKGDARPIHHLLAEKKHPFVFPYHFAHQQVSLAMAGNTPALGALNYRLSVTAPGAGQPFGSVNADARAGLIALSGLSPSLQRIVLAPSLFSHFYVGLRSLLGSEIFYAPSGDSLRSTRRYMNAYQLLPQSSVISADPEARETLWAAGQGPTSAVLSFVDANGAHQELALKFYACDLPGGPRRPMNQAIETGGSYGKSLLIQYAGDENTLTHLARHRCDVVITAQSWSTLEDWNPATLRLAQWKFTFVPEDDYALTPEEQAFFYDHYGIELRTAAMNPMTALDVFLRATSLDSDQAEALLAVKAHAPVKSGHFIDTNRAASGTRGSKAFPLSNHYGACYVNGVGGSDPGTRGYQNYDNAMALVQEPASNLWSLTNTSLERFDRLQRMIRLQKVTGLPFAQLDTLITAAMRCEGDANANMQINANTLRALGAYRYFNEHYHIDAETFAAFMYHVSPYASAGKVPQLDAVFNTPVLFETPLVIDDVEFKLDSPEPGQQKTIAQLCASLNVKPGIEFERIANATLTHVTPLRRSFAVLSSLYRQARIAQMFSLSVSDCWELTDLLGGVAYRSLVASGRLKALDANGKDILDVLMELDWAVRWLKANKLTVSALRAMVDAGPVAASAPALQDRLEQLAADTRARVVTADAVAALNLPAKSTGATINWFAELGKGAQALVDAQGLINAPALTVQDSDSTQLVAKVTALIETLDLAASGKSVAIATLSEWLLDALTQQQRLVEALLQEHTTLLPQMAVLVGRCAEVSPQQLLVDVLQAWPAIGAVNDTGIAAVLTKLHQVNACAKALSWTGIGAQALRTFLVNPAWLGAARLWPHSLDNLRAFKTYETLFNTLAQPEEHLLGYLEQANALVSKRPGKRQIALQAQTCNAALARLLGWSESEVAVLTALLPQQTAKTVAHIDWVRRAQTVALETGLNAAILLQACALNADSPDADWHAVGQAAMATVR